MTAVSGLSFPARSAELDLLSISAEAPSRLSISYGWVVDDNPEVTLSVANTSSYSIPGFYGEPNRSLYLVKDGRVVAEAYPTNVNPNGRSSPMRYTDAAGVRATRSATRPAGQASSESRPDAYWGILAPDESVSGTYLWRDLTGCWREDGSSTSITAGTYTAPRDAEPLVPAVRGGHPASVASRPAASPFPSPRSSTQTPMPTPWSIRLSTPPPPSPRYKRTGSTSRCGPRSGL